MGGPMSVNDDLPWILPALDLIRQAVAAGVPVIGHCLGGQLLAKALGGVISSNPVKEIGWGTVSATRTPEARQWLGDMQDFDAFHWHGETFGLPQGAAHILSSAYCSNQAFVIGPHLGMQCHVEMTEDMIRRWNEGWAKELTDPDHPPLSVQTPAQQLVRMQSALPVMRQTAEKLYTRWIDGLKRTS